MNYRVLLETMGPDDEPEYLFAAVLPYVFENIAQAHERVKADLPALLSGLREEIDLDDVTITITPLDDWLKAEQKKYVQFLEGNDDG